MFSAMRQALARRGPVFDDFDAVRAWLANHDGCTGRVGVIGFCLGGGFAFHGRGLADDRPGAS